MTITPSPTEFTTGATDAILAIECIFILIYLWRTPTVDRWKLGLWCWVFGLLALVSVLGALTHGFVLSESVRDALWKPLYLGLGLIVGLFLVGAVYDWRGRVAARRLVPWSIGMGAIFFGVTEIFNGAFFIFVLYEFVAMAIALMIYTYLAVSKRLKGATIVATAVFLNMVAAGVQASNVSFTLWLPFDHNGVFHLIQMAALAALGLGLHAGLRTNE